MKGTWQPAPSELVCSFDKITIKYQLAPDKYRYSSKLKDWVRKNYKYKFVPEDLLKMWGFSPEDSE